MEANFDKKFSEQYYPPRFGQIAKEPVERLAAQKCPYDLSELLWGTCLKKQALSTQK